MTGWSRCARVARLDFAYQLRRPLVLILILMVLLAAWSLSTGHMRISSGDASVGGKRAYITSEYASALTFCFLTILFYAFFVSVAAGTSIARDDELQVHEVLHTTGLRPREYVWGKFAGVLAAFLVVLGIQVGATMFCQYALPVEDADKIRGPFALSHYLRPALVFSLPTLVFLAGTSFWLGERTRRAMLVFLFPVALVMFCAFFFWEWDPEWLDTRINRVLLFLDPSGYRWLNETHVKVDRGVDYYNTMPVGLDTTLVVSRLAMIAVGLAAVAASARHFGRVLRGTQRVRVRIHAGESVAVFSRAAPTPAPLAALAMQARPSGFLHQAATIARFELLGLASSAGLYLFIPLILVQTIVNAYYAEGVWGTRLIVTSGGYAIGTMNTLTLCTLLLLLFYTVESLDRENATRLGQIYASTPVRTAAILFGKSLANCFVGLTILLAAGLGAVIVMLAQNRVTITPLPFVIVWGLLLVPTLLFWTAIVMALFAVLRNKYATYGLALAVLIGTGILQMRGKMNWVWNWNLWSAALWSDLGTLEPNAWPLFLNRLLYLGATVFFLAFAVRLLARREADATRVLQRLAPAHLLAAGASLTPFAVLPLGAAIFLGVQVVQGFQSERARAHERGYWKHNLATWKDAPKPSPARVDIAVSLEPARHTFRTQGTYRLVNFEAQPLTQVALTLGQHIREPKWTLDGSAFEPENRTDLYVFTLPAPLAPLDTVSIGFEFGGRFPAGTTRNGGGMQEFIEPSGVVLTSFSPSFAPLIGFQEGIGREKDKNDYEPRVYPDDYYKSRVRAGFGLERPSAVRTAIDAPAVYTLNGVGTCVENRVEAGRRTTVWESDHPVNIFNIVAGRWAVREGDGTAVYHHPRHTFNIDEISATRDGARRYYSAWFYPYPWERLKLSQFAGLARYAQGFATNITFSEDIGFLTLSDKRTNVAFMVTAHEAAHQWWGNLLVPGDGPGGDILSEGMAHFSTLLLHEQMLGLRGRIEFAKRIEERYGNARHVDAERPLVQIDGSKEGDKSVTYDKGGWVFWMLHDFMGRDANLAGLRAFLANHLDNPDHPLLQDFVAELRPFAADTTAYDTFTQQWFHEVVVPKYELESVAREPAGEAWVVTGSLRNTGTGRMPVEIAAVAGERFESDDYREARAQLVLGAGEAAPFRIECDFEPALVLPDPDARVLQLRRKYAVHRF